MFLFLNIGDGNNSLAFSRWNDDGNDCAMDGEMMAEALPLMAAR
jgi:hypothetical protein